MLSKSEKKPKKKRRKIVAYNDGEDGTQMLIGGYRRTRAGGGWRVLKKRLPR